MVPLPATPASAGSELNPRAVLVAACWEQDLGQLRWCFGPAEFPPGAQPSENAALEMWSSFAVLTVCRWFWERGSEGRTGERSGAGGLFSAKVRRQEGEQGGKPS